MQNRMYVASIVAVPWHQMDQTHKLMLQLLDEDANVVASMIDTIIMDSTNRLRAFRIQYMQVCTEIKVVFPHPGHYEIVAGIQDAERSKRWWDFLVQDVP